MARRMNRTDQEARGRLNAIIDTGEYKTGLSMSVGDGGTRWIDDQLNAITEQYGGMTYLKSERMIGVGRIKKILVIHPRVEEQKTFKLKHEFEDINEIMNRVEEEEIIDLIDEI